MHDAPFPFRVIRVLTVGDHFRSNPENRRIARNSSAELRRPFRGNLARRAVAAVVFTWRRPGPAAERCSIRLKDFDLERVARRSIARMARTAVSAGTGRQGSEQIDLREELNEVAGADGTCLHEVLMRVLGETGAHEDIEHVVDMMLHRARFRLQFGGKRAGQVGMAAEIVASAAQQEIGVRIAACADDVVDAGTVRIPAVPAERVMTNGHHGPETRHGAP